MPEDIPAAAFTLARARALLDEVRNPGAWCPIGAEDQGGVAARVEVVQSDGGGDRRVLRHRVARREHDGNRRRGLGAPGGWRAGQQQQQEPRQLEPRSGVCRRLENCHEERVLS